MCGGGSSTTTTTQQIPEEVRRQYVNLMNYANQVATLPYQQYTGDLIAGNTAAQNQAYNNINNLQGTGQGYYNAAAGYTAQGASPVSSSAISNYLSPYTQQVVDATRANMQENNAQAANRLTGNAISSGAFGGDRAGVAQAELARQQNLADNQTIAGLYNTGYSQALSAAQQDQQNALAAGNSLQNLGTAASQTGLNEAQAQLEAGNAQQQQNQNQLNAQYEQWQNQQQYPYETATWLSQLSTGLGSGMGGSSTTTSSQGKATGGRVGLASGGDAISSSLGRFDLTPKANSLPNAPATQPQGDKTLQTLGTLAKVAMLFLNTGGRVGLASGGAFTPTISPSISGAAQVPGSAGTYLPAAKSPLSSLKVNMPSGARLPTAPAAPIQQSDASGTLLNAAQTYDLLKRASSAFDDGKGDKAQYAPTGALSATTGATPAIAGTAASLPADNIPSDAVGRLFSGDATKAAATAAGTASDPAALASDTDMISDLWKQITGLFSQGGAITPNSGGMGYRRGGSF